jgi:hypothetical protein
MHHILISPFTLPSCAEKPLKEGEKEKKRHCQSCTMYLALLSFSQFFQTGEKEEGEAIEEKKKKEKKMDHTLTRLFFLLVSEKAMVSFLLLRWPNRSMHCLPGL